MDLVRSWLGAERIHAPLKRLDRLLGNPRLHAERERIYAGMVRWLVRSSKPIILVDGCRLKADGQWHLLRAAVPVGGRTLTLFEMIFPQRLLASPQAERRGNTWLVACLDALREALRRTRAERCTSLH